MGELRKLRTFEFCGIEWAIWKGHDEYLLTRTYSEIYRTGSNLLDDDSDDKSIREFSFARAIFDSNKEIVERVLNKMLDGLGLEDKFFSEVEADLEGKVEETGKEYSAQMPVHQTTRIGVLGGAYSIQRHEDDWHNGDKYLLYFFENDFGEANLEESPISVSVILKEGSHAAKLECEAPNEKNRLFAEFLNYVLPDLRDKGVDTVYVTTSKSNLGFYVSQGFTRTRSTQLGWLQRIAQPLYEIFSITLEKNLEQSPVVKK